MIKSFAAFLFIALIFCTPVYASSLEILTLLDISGESDTSLLIGASNEQIEKYLPNGKVKSQILAFLVKTGENEILFDAGLKDGHVVNELIKNNKKSEDIKLILITHLHPDHFGGLTDSENKAAFPNAEIYISKPEYRYWVDEQKNEAVINALKLYGEKVKCFDFGDEVVSCVKAIDTVGHTPGHTAFLVESEGEKILVAGDIMHFEDIQLPAPDVAVAYDVDPAKAIQSRKFLLDYAAQKNIPVAGMHLTGAGIFKVKKTETGYEKF